MKRLEEYLVHIYATFNYSTGPHHSDLIGIARPGNEKTVKAICITALALEEVILPKCCDYFTASTCE